MRTGKWGKICAAVFIVALIAALAGCSSGAGSRAVSLSDGWHMAAADTLEEKAAAKGFDEGDALPLEQLCVDGAEASGVYYSNTFKCSLGVGRGEAVLLRTYDACGCEKIWVNGKEVSADADADALDVTKQIRKSGTNTLVVYCSGETASPGSRVALEVRPQARIEYVSAEYDAESGRAQLKVAAFNAADEAAEAKLSVLLSSLDNNTAEARAEQTVSLPAGRSEQTVELDLSTVILWERAKPYIYKVNVSLGDDSYSDYVGFKSVSADEGGYTVNGRPTFIKCGQITRAAALGNVRSTIQYLKTAGFNAVCVQDGEPTEAMMDYCDEVGIMALYSEDATCARHVSAVQYGGATAVLAAGGADAAALQGLPETGLALVELAYGNAPVDGGSLAEWYANLGGGVSFAAGEAQALAESAEVGDMAALITAARGKEIAGVIVAMDMTQVKTDFVDVMPDALDNLRFILSADKTNLYNTDTLRLSVGLSNCGVLDPGTYRIRISVVGDSGLAFETDAELELTDVRVSKVLRQEIPLADFAPGEYTVACEMYDDGHPTCGEITVLVSDRAALPKLSGVIYGAGLSEHQKSLLTAQGASVAEYTGTQTGTVILGAGCEDRELLEQAKSAKKLIVLAPQNFGYEGLPVEAAAASVPSVFAVKNEYTEGCMAGGYLSGAKYGDIFTGSAFTANAQTPVVAGLGTQADGSVQTALLCGVFETESGTAALCTLKTDAENPFTDMLLLNLAGR